MADGVTATSTPTNQKTEPYSDPATGMVIESPAPDFSSVPGHVEVKPTAQSAPAAPEHSFWQRVKDFNSMRSDDYLKKYAADDQRIHDTVQKVVHAIIPLSAEMDQAGQILEKTKAGGQVKEFAQEQLAHPEQFAMGGEFGGVEGPAGEFSSVLEGATKKFK